MEMFKRDIDPNRLFRFRFKSQNMPDKMAHYVVTDDINKMYKFLKQHNFDISIADIDMIIPREYEIFDEHMLVEYMLKSNYSDQIYRIYTTEVFVCDCSQYVSSILSSSLVFNSEQIIRSDVPLMELISGMIQDLDHVYVLDHTVCDYDGKPYSSNYERYTKVGFPNSKSFDKMYMHDDETVYDDSGIYESMGSHISTYSPLPFTLEAYISFFTSLLTDSYT